MPTSLAANALTTETAVKAELSISVTTYDDQIRRLINVYSRRIENYCGRSFATWSGDEKLPGLPGTYLAVTHRPIIAVTDIKFWDAALDGSAWEIHDAGAGLIYLLGGVFSTAQVAKAAMPDIVPGTERNLYTVSYSGGYILPKADTTQIRVDGDWSNELVHTLTIDGHAYSGAVGAHADEKVLLEEIQTAIAAGGLYTTLIVDDQATEGAGRWHLVVTSASPMVVSVSANMAWQSLITKTLPDDLEEACILAVVSHFRSLGRDPRIKSEALGAWSASYALPAAGESGLPAEVEGLLQAYRSIPL